MNNFLNIAFLAEALLIAGCKQPVKRPNVVFIICDQMSPRAMGWTGETEVRTPNLDDFSNSTYCFTNAYCTSPLCAPSRHSLYTGVYPSMHGVLKNDMKMRENLPTIISMFNANDYTTANIGKMHNAPYHHRRDFQYVLNHEFFTGAAGISHYDAYLRSELDNRGIIYNPFEHLQRGKLWLQVKEGIGFINPLPEELTPENWMTREALKFMDDQLVNRSGKPFFLHLSYFPPHHPYAPVDKFAKMYLDKLDQLKLPPNFSQEEMRKWCKGGTDKPDSLTIEDVKYLRAMYFGFVTQLDAALGDLFKGMEKRGIMENTIIVFTSDHGDNLGEHGRFYKSDMFEGSVGVPLMIRWPGEKLKIRKIIEDNVSLVDLVPTLLKATGITPADYMQGKDMLPLMKGKESWKDHMVYSEYYAWGREPSQLMLRKGDMKLYYNAETNNGMFEMRFYNLRNDPWELNDLSENNDNAVPFVKMSDELMDDYWKKAVKTISKDEPVIVPRVKYDINWPADPWKAVKIKTEEIQ